MILQNNYKKDVYFLKKDDKKMFFWQDFACPKQFQICIDAPSYGASCNLNFDSA
jgi:hypothetical protein